MMFKRVIATIVIAASACACDSAPSNSWYTQPATNAPAAVPNTSGGAVSLPTAIDEDVPDAEQSTTRNFYFVIDGSGSMDEKPGGTCTGDQRFQTKLDGAKWAVEQFMSQVPDNVNLGLYVFDTRGAREVLPLASTHRSSFIEAVRGIRASGGTPLAEAIATGAKALRIQFKRQLFYGEYRLIVVTDGEADGIPAAAQYARSGRPGELGALPIPIYTIGLCIGDQHPLREYSFSYQRADSMQDLAQGLKNVLAETEAFNATFQKQK